MANAPEKVHHNRTLKKKKKGKKCTGATISLILLHRKNDSSCEFYKSQSTPKQEETFPKVCFHYFFGALNCIQGNNVFCGNRI